MLSYFSSLGIASFKHHPFDFLVLNSEMARREIFLCGDIGGTNTRFALYEVKIAEGAHIDTLKAELVSSKKYINEQHSSFLEVLKQFLYHDAQTAGATPLTACFAVAGPVKGNTVKFTNRDSWSIDGDVISHELHIPVVRLVNDFKAVGYGLLTLNEEKECIVLQKGVKDPTSPIACIGAGTGLGECFLTPDAFGQYHCFPCEGGHSEFAPRNDLEMELLTFLKHKFEQKHRISVERIVSGSGLANVYEFLRFKFPEKVNAEIDAKILAAGDFKGARIAENMNNNELCKQTMDIFASAYGAEAGVAGLKWLPYGGLYLTGGLTPKNIDILKSPNGLFMSAFADKGRVSGMLSTIPVYAVMVEDLGERGAEYIALKLLKERIFQSTSEKSAPTPTATTDPIQSKSNFALFATALAVGVTVGVALSKWRN